MSLAYSPADPEEQPKEVTLVEKLAAVIVFLVLIVGALTLLP